MLTSWILQSWILILKVFYFKIWYIRILFGKLEFAKNYDRLIAQGVLMYFFIFLSLYAKNIIIQQFQPCHEGKVSISLGEESEIFTLGSWNFDIFLREEHWTDIRVKINVGIFTRGRIKVVTPLGLATWAKIKSMRNFSEKLRSCLQIRIESFTWYRFLFFISEL